ncbi:MAG: hypothetical protein R3F11_03530 [Verrucomicrobiales bacterium]
MDRADLDLLFYEAMSFSCMKSILVYRSRNGVPNFQERNPTFQNRFWISDLVAYFDEKTPLPPREMA